MILSGMLFGNKGKSSNSWRMLIIVNAPAEGPDTNEWMMSAPKPAEIAAPVVVAVVVVVVVTLVVCTVIGGVGVAKTHSVGFRGSSSTYPTSQLTDTSMDPLPTRFLL